jgi:RNA polymerase sigma-70 factor (ECF subfamily)
MDEQVLINELLNPKTQRQAFEKMVQTYSERLYWIVRRLVLTHDNANDVLQNTFIKAWSRLSSFRGDAKLLTWLSRIALNESIDFLRKEQKAQVVSADEEMGVGSMLMADSYFDGEEVQAILQEAIAQLPEVQRTVFTLRYYEEMKYSEMSKLLDTSEGSLKASYHIAVKKISEYFHSRD